MNELEQGFRLSEVIEMVRRRLPIVIAAAIVGAVLGYLVFASAPETFNATARVQVEPIKLDQFSSDAKQDVVDVATEMDLVKSDSVADAVRTELSLPGENRAILQRVTVATEPDSLVLKVSFDGDTAKQAQDGANAVAQGYLDQRMAKAAGTRDSAVERLNAEINEASDALAEAAAAVETSPDGSTAKAEARTQEQKATNELTALQDQRSELNQFDPNTVGSIVRKASLPAPTTSKMAIGKGIGVFGIVVLIGLGIAWFLDRRDGLGGGRRRIEQIVPDANLRLLPGSRGEQASAAEVDAAIDRLAVELVAGGTVGRASSVLVVGAGTDPPVALAEELASSLTFAGIPSLFVLAGTTDRALRQAQSVASFADLVTSGSLTGPHGLPAAAGETVGSAGPTVSWLRPKGSAEAAGLLRRAVVDSLITKAGRDRFETVVFVAPSPTRTASGSALGQWVGRVALVVGRDERDQAEAAATALAEAGVRVTEVVWT